MAEQIGSDNIQDTAFVREQYASQDNTNALQFPIVPTTAIVSLNGLVGPTVTLSGGTTGLSFAVGGTTISLTGVLVPADGGTGISSYAQGDLLYASAGTTLSKLAKDTNATRYLANTGTSNNPAWAQINLTNGVTGILPIANGGAPKSNSTNTAPGVGNDNTQGYAINSLWTDTTGPTSYICQSAATGAAVWHAIP